MSEQKWLLDGPKVIDLGSVSKLKVALVRGQVDIVGHDEPTTRVEVHSVSGKDLRVSFDGDSLEIDHPQLRWDNFIEVFRGFRGSARADVSILVPRDVALKFGIVSSTGLISGIHGDASISTVNGDLTIEGHVGDITVNSVSGEIVVSEHTGRIAAHTVNGDVTASGSITRFTIDGVSSNIFLDVEGEPDLIQANTVNGDITARLHGTEGADYRINTVNGRINLDDTEVSGVRGSYNGKYGSLDEHFLDFRANTVNGNVAVLHTGASAKAKAGRK